MAVITAELWQAGVLVSTLGTWTIAADGVMDFPFDAAALANATGKDVELRLTSDTPVSFGAINWIAEFAPDPTLAIWSARATTTLATSGDSARVGAVAMSALATLVAGATREQMAAAALVATSTLSSIGVLARFASAPLTASAVLSALSTALALASVPMTASAVFVASSSDRAALSATSALSTTSALTTPAAATLVSTSSLSSAGNVTRLATAPLAAAASLSAMSAVTAPAAVSMAAAATFTAAFVPISSGASALSAQATLSASTIPYGVTLAVNPRFLRSSVTADGSAAQRTNGNTLPVADLGANSSNGPLVNETIARFTNSGPISLRFSPNVAANASSPQTTALSGVGWRDLPGYVKEARTSFASGVWDLQLQVSKGGQIVPADVKIRLSANVFIVDANGNYISTVARVVGPTWQVGASSYVIPMSFNPGRVFLNPLERIQVEVQVENLNIITDAVESPTAGYDLRLVVDTSDSFASGFLTLPAQTYVDTRSPGLLPLVASSSLSAMPAASVSSADAVMTAASTLAAPSISTATASVSMDASATLSAAATLSRTGVAPLAADATLTVAGIRATSGVAGLVSAATLTTAGVVTDLGAAPLVASSTLTSAGVVTDLGTVPLVASSTLTSVGTRAVPGVAPLFASSTLTSAGVVTDLGAAALIAASSLGSGNLLTGGSVTGAAWAGGSTTMTTGVTDPQGGATAFSVTFPVSAGNAYSAPPVPAGQKVFTPYVHGVWIRSADGSSVPFKWSVEDIGDSGSAGNGYDPCTATGAWTYYTKTATTGAVPNARPLIYSFSGEASGKTLHVWAPSMSAAVVATITRPAASALVAASTLGAPAVVARVASAPLVASSTLATPGAVTVLARRAEYIYNGSAAESLYGIYPTPAFNPARITYERVVLGTPIGGFGTAVQINISPDGDAGWGMLFKYLTAVAKAGDSFLVTGYVRGISGAYTSLTPGWYNDPATRNVSGAGTDSSSIPLTSSWVSFTRVWKAGIDSIENTDFFRFGIGNAAVTQSFQITGVSVALTRAAPIFSADSALTTAGAVAGPDSAFLVATSTLTALTSASTAALSASSTLTSSGVVTDLGTAPLVASTSLTAPGAVTVRGATALAAAATLATAGVVTDLGVASLVASTTLTAPGAVTVRGTTTLVAAATLSSAGLVTDLGVAPLTASAALTPSGIVTKLGAAPLVAAAALTSVGKATSAGFINAIASTALASAAAVTARGAVALVSTSTLASAALLTVRALASLNASSVLTPAPVATTAALAAMQADSSLTPVIGYEITAELWENGVFRRTLGAVDVSGGLLFDVSFDAAELADPTGRGVELRLFSSKSVDLAAITWIADYVEDLAQGVVGMRAGASLSATGIAGVSCTLAASSSLAATASRAVIATAALSAASSLSSATVTSTVTAELWENGVFRASLGTVTMSNEGNFDVSFNASLLSDPTGRGVELRLTSPTSTSFGAITWIADYLEDPSLAIWSARASSSFTITRVFIGNFIEAIAASSLVPAPQVSVRAVTALQATSMLSTGANVPRFGSVVLSATSVLTSAGIRLFSGAVNMLARAVLTTPATLQTGQVKIYKGGRWTHIWVRWWSGSAWVPKPVKFWNGFEWELTR